MIVVEECLSQALEMTGRVRAKSVAREFGGGLCATLAIGYGRGVISSVR